MFKSPLLEAVRKGKLKYVKIFVEEENKDINQSDESHEQRLDYDPGNFGSYFTPLHVACRHGHLEIVRYLIKKGARINEISVTHNRYRIVRAPSLFIAAAEGHAEIVKCLLDNGADEKFFNESLRLAVKYKHTEVAEIMLDKGAKMQVPLHRAIEAIASCDMIELLLKHGADINERYEGYSPLSLAMRLNADKIVGCLLENGADFRQQDFDTRFVPLLSGFRLKLNDGHNQEADCLEATKVLLDFIEKREGRAAMLEYLNDNDNLEGVCALHLACRECTIGNYSKAYELIELLLDQGADPTVKDDDDREPYHSEYIKDAGMREKVVQLFRKYNSHLDDGAS